MPNVIWSEGFEHYGLDENFMQQGLWAELTGASLSSSAPGARTGNFYMARTFAGAFVMRRVFDIERTKVGIASGIRLPSLPSSSNNLIVPGIVDNGGNNIVSVSVLTSGQLTIWDGNPTGFFPAGTLLFTTSESLTAGSWHHIEVVATISDTVGEIDLFLDGVAVAHLDSLDLGTALASQAKWQGSSSVALFDDFVTHDGDGGALGPARVLTVYPEGDGSPFDWTINGAATGAQAVDETVPDDDTSYIRAENANDVATFTMPELPADVFDVVSVFIPIRARQDEAGTTVMQSRMVSGSSQDDGATHSLTGSYVYYGDVYNVDPDTSSGWTKAAFESALLQIERTI